MRLKKFENGNRFGLRWSGKKKKQTNQELTVVNAHFVHIANLVMHVRVKPSPLKRWPENYGQSSISSKKLTQTD